MATTCLWKNPFAALSGKRASAKRGLVNHIYNVYGIQPSRTLKWQNLFAMAPRLDACMPCNCCTACGRRTWGVTEIGAGNTFNAQGQSCDQVFCEQKLFFICVNGCLGHHGGKQFSFTPETNAHVESRQISKPNLVLKSSYKQRPCEGIYILPSRVRFFCEYRVFLLYAHGYLINAQCISVYQCPFATVCIWFCNLNISANFVC